MSIPATILGGFLGAGKTTLLNRILASAPARTAVLVNDFGALNVDAALVQSDDGLTMELSGGCICCSLADGLGPAISRALDHAPEAILIEASGVSEPRRIAEFALLEPRLRLDLVVVLAHAGEIARHLADPLVGDIVERQFIGADLVVLNHTDTAPAPVLKRARDEVTRLAPNAARAETVRADLPRELLLPRPLALFATPSGGAGREAAHQGVFHSETWVPPAPLHPARLETLLKHLPRSLLRLKGCLDLAEEDGLQLLQWVSGRWILSPAPDKARPGLVAIGTDPDFRLAEALAPALADTVTL
ncbi:CobW family GTP-binding protein [Acidimangrovimonas sediminis]|uniref:CobW family GTP-binding protein n=1 Tax=Acidimangrovimonas sediminis TaxID=2056283 RepID=UPI000C8074E9|nr:GTP-binding protein [Acidimangrovimonas sediminis]